MRRPTDWGFVQCPPHLVRASQGCSVGSMFLLDFIYKKKLVNRQTTRLAKSSFGERAADVHFSCRSLRSPTEPHVILWHFSRHSAHAQTAQAAEPRKLREATAAKCDCSASQPPCRSTESSQTPFATHTSNHHRIASFSLFVVLASSVVQNTQSLAGRIHTLLPLSAPLLHRRFKHRGTTDFIRPRRLRRRLSLHISLFSSLTAHSTELRA